MNEKNQFIINSNKLESFYEAYLKKIFENIYENTWKVINLGQKIDFNKKVKNYKLLKFLKPYLKIEKTIIKFGETEIKKQKFH